MRHVNIKNHFKISDEIISKEIEGELVIVPLKAGIGKLDECLFSLNETGKIVWEMLDGTESLEKIIENLSIEFGVSKEKIGSDVLALIEKLLSKELIIEIQT